MKPNLNSLNYDRGFDEKVYKKAKAIAYNYLSYRSRSRGEILSKLLSKNINEKYTEKILIDLENEGFVNDASFAENYISYCIRNKHYSKKKIKVRLKHFLISKNIIEKKLSEMYTNEVELKTLNYIVEKRLRGQKKINSINKYKLINYLYKLGFDLGKIKGVVGEL